MVDTLTSYVSDRSTPLSIINVVIATGRLRSTAKLTAKLTAKSILPSRCPFAPFWVICVDPTDPTPLFEVPKSEQLEKLENLAYWVHWETEEPRLWQSCSPAPRRRLELDLKLARVAGHRCGYCCSKSSSVLLHDLIAAAGILHDLIAAAGLLHDPIAAAGRAAGRAVVAAEGDATRPARSLARHDQKRAPARPSELLINPIRPPKTGRLAAKRRSCLKVLLSTSTLVTLLFVLFFVKSNQPTAMINK